MYGQMTAGSWIYIGSQGIVQGTYETFVEMGRQHYGGDLKGKWILTAGLGGMGGAQPLAAIAGRRVQPQHRMPAEPHRHAPAHALRRRAGDRPRRRAGAHREVHARPARPSRSRCSATPPRSCRSWCAAACVRMRSPTRPARTIRCTATCRSAGRVEQWLAHADRGSGPRARRGQEVDARARRGDARVRGHGHPGVRLRQQHPPDGQGRRLRRTRSTSRASCRPTCVRCSAAASVRSAGSR